MSNLEFSCQNCGAIGPADIHGYCPNCGSESLAVFVETSSVKQEKTGIERMNEEAER